MNLYKSILLASLIFFIGQANANQIIDYNLKGTSTSSFSGVNLAGGSNTSGDSWILNGFFAFDKTAGTVNSFLINIFDTTNPLANANNEPYSIYSADVHSPGGYTAHLIHGNVLEINPITFIFSSNLMGQNVDFSAIFSNGPAVFGTINFSGTAAVPEPETFSLMLIGLLGVYFRMSKKIIKA